MPKKWKEYWDNVTYVDENGLELPESPDSYEKRESKITSVGNMTLLTSKLNKDVRNYNFKKKIEGEGKKQGIKKYASLSITSKDIIEEVYNRDIEWNECAIAKRAEKLGNEIVEIWGNK
ncbi:MAG: GmrSD restriction endonuclease domain-containing protein [Treponema sp.]